MKKYSVLTILLSFFFIQPIYANSTIISTNSFSTIKHLIKKNKDPHHLLLALDDDDTLTMMPCSGPLSQSKSCQYLGGPAWFEWQSKLPPSSKDRVWRTFSQLCAIDNFILSFSKMPIDDPQIPSTLKLADDLGVLTTVVTARDQHMINATETQFTQDRLLKLVKKDAIKTPEGHLSFPGFYFPKVWNNKAVRPIAYLHGVLYESGLNKGEMIKQFLNKTHETKAIKNIIFVDDTMQNVKDVAATFAHDPNVNVISVHFTRLSKHKADFLTGPHAKELQAIATKQWKNINSALKKNVLGYIF